MQRVIAWVQEGLFRLLGMLSAVSHALRHNRLGCSLGIVVLVAMALIVVVNVRGALRALAIYQAPVRPIYELADMPSLGEAYFQVPGLAFRDVGYEWIQDRYGWLGTYREVFLSYYLLLDEDTGWGLLVGSYTPLLESEEGTTIEPEQTMVTGQLVDMHADLVAVIEEDNWEQYGIVLLDRALEEKERRLPLRELVLIFGYVVGIGFLVLTQWFNYVFFRSEPDWLPQPPLPASDPEGCDWWEVAWQARGLPDLGQRRDKVDLFLSAVLPEVGTRLKLRFVDTDGEFRQAEDGWGIVAYHEDRAQSFHIPIPAGSIEKVVRGCVYFGRRPTWGLWVVYRDPQEQRRHLYLRFSRDVQRQAVHALLTAGSVPGPAGDETGSFPE